jgi:putative flippase GtrA
VTKLTKQLFLYLVCGGLGVASDYGLYLSLIAAGLHYQVANVAGYAAGTLVSFALNRIVTFGMRDRTGRRLASFLLVAATGYSVSVAMLWLLIDQAALNPAIAKGLTLPVVVALQFTLNRSITFRAAEGRP